MKVFYRISDKGYNKEKFPFATKEYCLKNFLSVWYENLDKKTNEINLYMDFSDKSSIESISKFVSEFFNPNEIGAGIGDINIIDAGVVEKKYKGSSAASWRCVFEEALKIEDKNEIVYFIEDDYLHLFGSRQAIIEGLARADYLTLYDCPDKYEPSTDYCNWANPLVHNNGYGGEETAVILTKSRHWKICNSTTMSFATTVKMLQEDKEIWDYYTTGIVIKDHERHPNDFECFLKLREKGRSLISPLPSLSTHCEPMWAAPLINWKEESEKIFKNMSKM